MNDKLEKYHYKESECLQMDAMLYKLTFQQREQLVLELLVDGVVITDIATIIHCEPELTQFIADQAIKHYRPKWANTY